MTTKKSTSIAMLLLLSTAASSVLATSVGPVTELFGPADFAGSTTLINFDSSADGEIANTLYQAQGVEFYNTGAPIPIINWSDIPRTTTSPSNVIATVDRYQSTGSEFSDYLDLLFSEETFEVGAYFGNDQGLQPTMQMQLSVFDFGNALIGSVLIDANANTSVDQFAGLRSDSTPFYRARFEHILTSGDLSIVLDDIQFTGSSAVPEINGGQLGIGLTLLLSLVLLYRERDGFQA